MIAQIWGSVK